MKTIRILAYTLILSALFFVPLDRVEIADLEPIQAVWLFQDGEEIILKTDTEDIGKGATVQEALINMKENSSGIIYLDTAQYLLVSQSAQQQIADMQPYLKGSALVCIWNGQGDMSEAVKYADSHKVGGKLKNWKPDSELPSLHYFIKKE
ncbi:MAG: hypothetical protein IKK11_06465 [Oscillospiraceae bacterium]|nr:hypothetical protein [Oscillospiraceae bacterium]